LRRRAWEYGGDYVVEQLDIGRGTDDPSYARINVSAEREDTPSSAS
jgi:hypothetical protein